MYLVVKLLLDTALYSLHRDGIFSSEITVRCSESKETKKSLTSVYLVVKLLTDAAQEISSKFRCVVYGSNSSSRYSMDLAKILLSPCIL